MNERTVNVGILGLGFMGQTHLGAYRTAAEKGFANRLVAICDADPQRRTGRSAAGGNLGAKEEGVLLFDPKEVRAYAEPAELFADPEVELISICTHTDTHVDLAIAALEAGKHVLVEKPVATTAAEVERLAAAAREAATLCMPAHCVRFWPGWSWLKGRIDGGEYGAVRSAVFRRLASPPAWAPDFYRNAARTGGALVDLHIHDADFVRWCFGEPESVSATGSLDHLTALYRYPNGPAHVVAEGGWDHTPGFAFQMRYVVVFEEATAEFDLSRDPVLTLSRGGECEAVELPGGDGYTGEVSHLLERIATGSGELLCTVDDAVGLARVLEEERRRVS